MQPIYRWQRDPGTHGVPFSSPCGQRSRSVRAAAPRRAAGGAARSLRPAIRRQPGGLGPASPVACTASVSCRSRSGSACISAVALHSRTSCGRGRHGLRH